MKSFSFTDRRPASHCAYNHLCYGIGHCSYMNGRSGRLTHSIRAGSSRTMDWCNNCRIPSSALYSLLRDNLPPQSCSPSSSPSRSCWQHAYSLHPSLLPTLRTSQPATCQASKTQASNPQPEAKPSAYQALWTSPHPRPTSRSNTPSPPTKPHSPSSSSRASRSTQHSTRSSSVVRPPSAAPTASTPNSASQPPPAPLARQQSNS